MTARGPNIGHAKSGTILVRAETTPVDSRGSMATVIHEPTRVLGETMASRRADPVTRFWNKVDRSDENGCWSWTGALTDGYGRFRERHGGRTVGAHRYAYELLVGPIPEGLVLDHLCRDRSCVNPAHLEPVTNKENILRGVGIPAQNASRTRCVHGHELGGENAYLRPGERGRDCRTCMRERERRYKARKRGTL